MKVKVNSVATDLYLGVLRVCVTVAPDAYREEDFNFFLPFNPEAKPTAAELEAIVEDCKAKALEKAAPKAYRSKSIQEFAETEPVLKKTRAKKAVAKPEEEEAPAAPVELPPEVAAAEISDVHTKKEVKVIYQRNNPKHADLLGKTFDLVNPAWRKTPDVLNLCRTIVGIIEEKEFGVQETASDLDSLKFIPEVEAAVLKAFKTNDLEGLRHALGVAS